MGSPIDEAHRSRHGETQRQVSLSHGFWIGKFEVNQDAYQKIMDANPSEFSTLGKFGRRVIGLDTKRFPVECVSWEDAIEFCSRLTRIERLAGRLPADWAYTLPTEAQWEYACRAKTTTATAFGENISATDANFRDDVESTGDETLTGSGRPREVGGSRPNAWGLQEMHGNVSEWCLDSYQDEPPGGIDPRSDVPDARFRVIRGGRWNFGGEICRSAYRGGEPSSSRHNGLGFRVALAWVSGGDPEDTKLPKRKS